jgi:phosphoglycerate dehydrogenase-like enzyme
VVWGLRDSDVVLTNSAGIHAVPLAEWVTFAMLWFTKAGVRILAQQQAHDWVEFTPGELRGRTLLIIGFGRIGQEVARRARALGVRVVAVKRDPSGSAAELGADALVPPSGLLAALAGADFVCLAVPLLSDTTGLIGRRELAAMAPHAVLINVARGPVVDEDALLEALRARRIGGAALDVFREEPLPPAHPLWELPGVLLSPHCVGGSPLEHERIVDIFTDNLARYLRGHPMRNLVDKQRGY